MRLAQYLAKCGVASRRQASRLIEAGRVALDGRQALHTDTVEADNPPHLLVDGSRVEPETKAYYLYHKPVGVDCRLLPQDPTSLIHRLPKDAPRLYPAGRLDKDSRGLLLLTNDGDLTHKLMHPDFHHHKTYNVQANKPISDDDIKALSCGVKYADVLTRACEARRLSADRFEIILTQGLNRQIRRMCQALGYKVIDLQRTAIMKLELNSKEFGEVAENKMRPLEAAELKALLSILS
ncbi:23S rRNA pseudouridine(2604) synthase RluF [Shewanella sp. SR44-3]|uniref:23S rRNA pseudouridine(2604) synthase RluF n=1 Tax=unclassified Shewanella TaxID=196818 RepID=UPI0015FA01E7|nr:23S rRNA pseudouridine(2604) synthase RluF [Shewanella sp. SR44-3]MBB1269047.1 23S rRNA pseudouridine(2604) synthase RluF [Shewanella sp. SR44-3]